jgi:hypothetical protein
VVNALRLEAYATVEEVLEQPLRRGGEAVPETRQVEREEEMRAAA